ncbi:MAG TPA: energy transducer TonB, partial [Sutterella wadsworthensis]|nr:energy transducer TonB [Sutterella wadsworthensis]HCE88538.1 energy transducer TonB [Sutterella wadsworthensis]
APAGPAPVQSAGAPVSAGQEGISELVYGQTTDPFLAEVKRAVESALHYPRKARMFHIEGTAVVQFIVDSNGKLTELKIFKSAGHPLLDKAAMRAVADAESNWSRPKGTVRLRFPIQFKLQS